MKKYVLLVLLLIFFSSCKQKEKVEKIDNNQKNDSLNIDLSEIKNIIKLQKNSNYIDYRPDNPYTPTEKDLLDIIPIVEKGLKNAGYKTLSNAEFELKIKEIIKDNKIKKYNSFTTIFTNPFDRTSMTLDKFEFEFDVNNQFAIKKYNFMIPMLFFADVVKIKKDNSYSITIPDYIIARNRYLFNDSKADLDWLLNNDKDFLKDLVISLGYDKEPKINKLLLEDFYEEFSDKEMIGQFFFTKDLNNNFCIRQGLVNYVRNITTLKDNRFIYALDNYTFHLYNKDLGDIYGTDNPLKMFNAIEKAHIVAIVASIEVPAIAKYKPQNPELWNYAGSSLYNLIISNPEIVDIIIKQNYFGIKNMKEVLEDTVSEIEVDNIKRNNK